MIGILTLPRFPLLDFFPFKIAIDAISGTGIALGCGSIHLDAVFADDGEGVQHVGGAEKDANLFAEVHEL